MTQRSWAGAGKGPTVGEAISQVDQPGREKKRGAVNWSDGRVKSSGKEPKPGDRDERSIETNQIKPDGRESAPCCPRTSQRDVPASRSDLNGLAPFPIDLILNCVARRSHRL